MKITVDVDVPMTVETLAELFTNLDDDQQARFFVEVARILGTWPAGAADGQVYAIGKHLRTCECSTEEARDLVLNLASCVRSGDPRV